MQAEPAGRLVTVAADRLVAAASRQHAALAEHLGLLPIEVLALAALRRSGGLSPTELARTLLVSSSGATAIVQRLDAAGLIEREQVSGTGRQVVVHVTARAR